MCVYLAPTVPRLRPAKPRNYRVGRLVKILLKAMGKTLLCLFGKRHIVFTYSTDWIQEGFMLFRQRPLGPQKVWLSFCSLCWCVCYLTHFPSWNFRTHFFSMGFKILFRLKALQNIPLFLCSNRNSICQLVRYVCKDYSCFIFKDVQARIPPMRVWVFHFLGAEQPHLAWKHLPLDRIHGTSKFL